MRHPGALPSQRNDRRACGLILTGAGAHLTEIKGTWLSSGFSRTADRGASPLDLRATGWLPVSAGASGR